MIDYIYIARSNFHKHNKYPNCFETSGTPTIFFPHLGSREAVDLVDHLVFGHQNQQNKAANECGSFYQQKCT